MQSKLIVRLGTICLIVILAGYYRLAAQEEKISAITVVGSPTGDPRAVAIDGANAYFGYDYRSTEFCDNASSLLLIEKMNLSTGAKTTLLQRTNFCQAAASSLAPDNTHVYYLRSASETNSIRRVTIATPAVDALVVNQNATSLLVDATNLYWTTATLVRRRAKSGGAIVTLFTAPAGARVSLLGQDNAFLFFDQSSGSSNTQSHRIRKVPIAGGAATTLHTVTTGRYITGFGSDAGNVYWTEKTWGNSLDGFVQRVSKLGAGFHTIRTLPATRRAHKIAVTASRIYWVEATGFDVRDPSVIRSRTNPTGNIGVFANETPSREGISALGPLRINGTRMFWYEHNWASVRQIVRGALGTTL